MKRAIAREGQVIGRQGSGTQSGYHAAVTVALGVYVAGMALALWRTDAGWPTRIALAVLWPLGPLAFVATISVLLAAALVAFPAFGAVVAAAALLVWWLV